MFNTLAVMLELEELHRTDPSAAFDKAFAVMDNGTDEEGEAAADFLNKYNMFPQEDGADMEEQPSDPVINFLRDLRVLIDTEPFCPTKRRLNVAA